MAMFNEITDNFTTFKPFTPEPIKLIEFPLNPKPYDISNFAAGINKNGNIIVKDETNPESNDIFKYNPTEEIIEEAPLKVSSNLSDRKKYAMEYFINKGLLPIHAAGIVGNLMAESGLDPNAINPKSGAYGIAQWLSKDRVKGLHSMYGKNPTFEQQLDYVWHELNNSHKSALNHLLSTTTYSDAVRSIMNKFERPSEKEKILSINYRLKSAKELLT